MRPQEAEVQLRDIAGPSRSVGSMVLLESVKRDSGFFRNVSISTNPGKLLVKPHCSSVRKVVSGC